MTLFSHKTDRFPIVFDKIDIGNIEFELNRPLEIFGSHKEGMFHISYELLKITVDIPNKEDLKRLFKQEFLNRYLENKSENSALYMEFRKLVKIPPIILEPPF